MTTYRFSLLVVLVLVVVACAGVSPDSNTADPSPAADSELTILVLGDSIFESNKAQGESIPEVLGRALGTAVHNAAQGGAHFSISDSAITQALDVRSQYQEGDWEWVVIQGGGNDYMDDCGCGECDAQIEELVSSDGLAGEIPEFARNLVKSDTHVMFVGYYEVPSDAEYGFDVCDDEVIEHNARLALMAKAIDGLWFVSAADVVMADDRAAYAEDRVHPSVEGSRLVGEHIAAAITNAETG